jgi:hypothetical protein
MVSARLSITFRRLKRQKRPFFCQKRFKKHVFLLIFCQKQAKRVILNKKTD